MKKYMRLTYHGENQQTRIFNDLLSLLQRQTTRLALKLKVYGCAEAQMLKKAVSGINAHKLIATNVED
jgi:hypothetical protein